MLYSEWKACERIGIIPPGIKPVWDENPYWMKAMVLAYNEIREREESDHDVAMIGAMTGAKI